ncbi:hypothetical protein BZG36_04840, partial [Bifiguratus adelaidae]
LMEAEDDGLFIAILKKYFANLDAPLYPNSSNPKARNLTKFNELMLVAFREFSMITNDTVEDQRRTHQLKVVAGIESFSKRSALRNLKSTGAFSKDEVAVIYDKYYSALYYHQRSNEKKDTRMEMATFRRFLASLTEWANLTRDEEHLEREGPKSSGRTFMERLFQYFDKGKHGQLSLQNCVSGLDELIHGDLSSRLKVFFDVHDIEHDGSLSKDEIVQVSETLLFLMRGDDDQDDILASISGFINGAFQFSQSNEQKADGTNEHFNLSFASFSEIIHGDDKLRTFFERDFPESFNFSERPVDRQKHLGREIFDDLRNDGTRFAQVGTAQTSTAPRPTRRSSSSQSVPTVEAEPMSKKAHARSAEAYRDAVTASGAVEDTDDLEEDEGDVLEEVNQLLNEFGHDEEDV